MSSAVEQFRNLHHANAPLLLPNAWDAASAALLQEAGAGAVATSSAALAWSLGYADGGALPPAELLAAVGRIMRVMRVPLTVDIEQGYSPDPEQVAELVASLATQGVAGINLEDGSESPAVLAEKITAIRTRLSADRMFINARTDIFLRKLAPPAFEGKMTLRRAELYKTAGADGLFVPGLSSVAMVADIARGTDLAVNLMAIPTLPATEELFAAGMRRLSLGITPFCAAYGAGRDATRAFLDSGSVAGMFPSGRIDYAAMNALVTSLASNGQANVER